MYIFHYISIPVLNNMSIFMDNNFMLNRVPCNILALKGSLVNIMTVHTAGAGHKQTIRVTPLLPFLQAPTHNFCLGCVGGGGKQ